MKTRLLSIIMLMVMALPALAEEFIVDGIKYATNDDGTTVYVTSNDPKYEGDIVIHASVTYEGKTYDVTSIGYESFRFCSGLTSINIPDGVTSIGNYAFEYCSSLTSIVVDPNNAYYDSRDNCNAIIEKKSNTLVAGCQNTIIPESVTNIGDGAFSGCSGLTSINIPESVTWIGSSAFSGCSGLTSINIPESVFWIGFHAFYNCSGLTSINIPESVFWIGIDAFWGCSGLTRVDYGGTIADWLKIEFYNYFSNPLRYAHHLYIDGNEVTEVVVPDGVTSIGNYAFYRCSGLTSVTIPDGVTSIGDYAFSGCSGLTSITIPESVTSIGDGAFEGCSGLTSINIPDGVTSIGSYAFYSCSGLTSITIPESVTSIGYRAFDGCSGLTSINIPESVTSIGYRAFSGCSNINELHIGSIDSWCKTSMAGVSSNPLYVTSSKDVKIYVGDEEVTELIIPEGVTDIKNYAFRNCSGLTSVTIPEGVTNIGDGAFNGCSNLTSVIIPNTVTRIGSYSDSPTCYVKVMGENVDPVVAQAEGGVFKITSSAGAMQEWDTRFYIGLPQALEAGDEYAVTFDYKASSEVTIYTWAEGEPDYYHHYMAIDPLNFTTEWQTLEFEGVVEDAQATGGQGDGYKTISFNLSTDKENDVTFEIRNISVVANGVSCGNSSVFSSCEKLDRLTCLATLPPEVGFDIFEESGLLSGGTVYIPEGTTASYQEKWGTELNYVELTDLPQIKDGVGGKTEVVAKDYKQVTLYITIESGYTLGDIIVNGVVVYSANKVASDVTVIRNADGTYTLNGVSSTDVIEVTFNKSGSSSPTAVNDIKADKSQKVIKTIEDGRIVIIRDGKKYDVMGREL